MTHILDATSPLSAERELLLAVLHRSLHDLKPNAPAQDRSASVAFFSNADGHLQTVCDLLDLDYGQVQARVRRWKFNRSSSPFLRGSTPPIGVT